MSANVRPDPFSGRIQGMPSNLLHEAVLEPQFRFEAEFLLRWYVAIEKVLAVEYHRQGLVTAPQLAELGRALDGAGASLQTADPLANMSDIAFALERQVEGALTEPVPAWHIDRSRNDLQACAQLLFGLSRALDTVEALLEFASAVQRLAAKAVDIPMPGYTHFQAAQVMTPGFYLAAVSDHALHSARRLLACYDGNNLSPLGAGAMAGQDLPWDREAMAALLGFEGPRPHALTSVASRRWACELTAELSLFGVELSRFCTDLLTWGSSEYGFIDLPDELSGISSAMPQKKNFPVLERIRGKSAHLSSFHLDLLMGQRNTPYQNLVEVSKESTTHLRTAFDTAETLLRLCTAVFDNLRFSEERMLAACESEYLGGFTLANLLTLHAKVPWRRSQVLAGRYIVAATAEGRRPAEVAPELLRELLAEAGFAADDPAALLREAFDVERGVRGKRTAGSVSPDSVAELLRAQNEESQALAAEWQARCERRRQALLALDGALGAST